MTNIATHLKVDDEQSQTRKESFGYKRFEKYYECPICGNEPFPETPVRKKFFREILKNYFCPKCHAITLVVSVRIRQNQLATVLRSNNCASRGGIDRSIQRMEEKELTARQKMLSITDPYKIYQKIQNCTAHRRI